MGLYPRVLRGLTDYEQERASRSCAAFNQERGECAGCAGLSLFIRGL